jgi:hypothetical protein
VRGPNPNLASSRVEKGVSDNALPSIVVVSLRTVKSYLRNNSLVTVWYRRSKKRRVSDTRGGPNPPPT